MAVEGFFENKREPVEAKVGELTPQSRAVNVTAKVVSKSEIRDIPMGRDGSPHKVCDALVGDETGSIYLTLWDDNIEKVNENDTIRIENGYVTLFKGNMRLNIGRYGKMTPAETPLEGEVNTENLQADIDFTVGVDVVRSDEIGEIIPDAGDPFPGDAYGLKAIE